MSFLIQTPSVVRVLLAAFFVVLISPTEALAQEHNGATFGDRYARLVEVEGIEILRSEDSMIAVSGPWQGRVFMSTLAGENGEAIGWFPEAKLEASDTAQRMASMGGASRLRFGPEWGRFALFFDEGVEQSAAHVRSPSDLNDRLFTELERSERSITHRADLSLTNASGFRFELAAQRQITLHTRREIEAALEIELGDSIRSVGFEATTNIENTGDRTWRRNTGLISIWELSCLVPSAANWVIHPVQGEFDGVTEYFTSAAGRVREEQGVVFYRADAAGLNKIGVQPQHCRNVMGAYDSDRSLLTIVKFDLNPQGIYVNSQWEHENPYHGDVTNVFNGEVNADLGRNWPFYELESQSDSLELGPGQTQRFSQSLFHFRGDGEALSEISEVVLGVSLKMLPP